MCVCPTWSVIDWVVYKYKVYVASVLMVEGDLLETAVPQVQLGLHIQQLGAVIQLVGLGAMHVPAWP